MNAGRAPPRVAFTAGSLTVEWAEDEVAEFPSIWLRDNLPEDRDPHSGQRLVDIADLPDLPLIRSAALREGGVAVEWEGERRTTTFPLAWLLARVHDEGGRRPEQVPHRWLDGARLAARDFAWEPAAALGTDSAVRLRWLTRLLQQGLAFMSDVPGTDAALVESVAGIGRVCETNYGMVFDVRSIPQPENLAYSDLGLGLHTDNPYRDPVPGFQALHVLQASPDGGDSLFADGFAVGNHLRHIEPVDFDILTTTLVPFHYRAPGADLYAERPLIQLSAEGEISAVHYNSRSIAPLPARGKDLRRFYKAYRRFAGMLRDPSHQLRTRLQNGNLAVFDNQRILHGRTAFSSNRHARHLRGCYLTRDSVHSQTAQLHRQLAPQDHP